MLGNKMNWWKAVLARIAMRLSDFLAFIRGIASFDRVLLREVQSMTWGRVMFSRDQTSLETKQGRSNASLCTSQRRRADTTRLSR